MPVVLRPRHVSERMAVPDSQRKSSEGCDGREVLQRLTLGLTLVADLRFPTSALRSVPDAP